MILRTTPFRRITIVGVGFMGGSLGLAIKQSRLAREVIGLSRRQSSLVQALKSKAVDVGYTDIAKAVRNADCVIFATPVDSIIKLIPAISPHLKRGCIVTDMGSIKAEIVEIAEKTLNSSALFVGSHPLVGSEKKGVEYSKADLFKDSVCIMTPTKNTNKSAREKVRRLWEKVGCQVKDLDPEEHDIILSFISHLPHLAAYGLVESVPDEYMEFVSKGFTDTTRIASSTPQVWSDICLANSKHIVKSLDEFVRRLSDLRKAILTQDQKRLLDHFTAAKEKRDKSLSKDSS